MNITGVDWSAALRLMIADVLCELRYVDCGEFRLRIAADWGDR